MYVTLSALHVQRYTVLYTVHCTVYSVQSINIYTTVQYLAKTKRV
jgi:hypothetical protein